MNDVHKSIQFDTVEVDKRIEVRKTIEFDRTEVGREIEFDENEFENPIELGSKAEKSIEFDETEVVSQEIEFWDDYNCDVIINLFW